MGTRSVFAASTYVDRQEFIQLVGSRELEREFPGALGIGYIEYVPADLGSVDAFAQRVREEGAPWFEITEPPDAAALPGSVIDGRFIIKYIEPMDLNRGALGIDIGANPVRREAAERAVLSNDACLTGALQLVQDDQQVAGFLYMLPVYTIGMPTDTSEQRIAAIRGWVYMPLHGPKVFEGIASAVDGELDIEVFDGNRLSSGTLIYDSDDQLDYAQSVDDQGDDFLDRTYRATREVEIGGRIWLLALSTMDSFERASRGNGWSLLLSGTALSLLLSTMVYMQGNSTRRAWALAEGMTTDLRAFAEKAEQATEAKTAFLANMSHEIRTPMTAILGFTDLLSARIDQDNQDMLDHTNTIKRNGEHLLEVINDILDISKIEAGKLAVERIEVRPDQMVAQVLSLMRVKSDEKKLPLSATFLTPVPAVIKSDPVRLRQVLVNLIGNAIKFTDKGAVTIEVRYDEKMDELKFAVIDTGIGMTGEQVTRLFGAFEQADATTTREFGGTGLGLHISQRLATMLDGRITCNSRHGQGSTFTLIIDTGKIDADTPRIPAGPPRVVCDAEAAGQKSASGYRVPEEMTGNKPPLHGVKILLAEDGKDNQRLINHHLTKAGAVVTIVDNGKLAVQALTVNGNTEGPLLTNPPFDVLLTDMQMPEMDGYTAARLLRKLGSTLPIVALTAHAMKEDVEKCLNAGCDFYASKPIDKHKLIAICLEAISKVAA